MKIFYLILSIYYMIQLQCGQITFFNTDQPVAIFFNSSDKNLSRHALLHLECIGCLFEYIDCVYCFLKKLSNRSSLIYYNLTENSYIYSIIIVTYRVIRTDKIYNTSDLLTFQKSDNHVEEYQVVETGEDIECHPKFPSRSFICLFDKKRDYMPTEIMNIKNYVLKFNSFAPAYNYTCNCVYYNKDILVARFIIFMLNEIPNVQGCEMPNLNFSELTLATTVTDIIIFLMFICTYLLAAFLVTDGVFKTSIQSNLMYQLGFDKTWVNDNHPLPPFLILYRRDGKERFKSLVKLIAKSEKKVEKMKLLNQPMSENMIRMYGLMKEKSVHKTLTINKTEVKKFHKNKGRTHYPSAEIRFETSKREMIMKELQNRKNARNQARVLIQKSAMKRMNSSYVKRNESTVLSDLIKTQGHSSIKKQNVNLTNTDEEIEKQQTSPTMSTLKRKESLSNAQLEMLKNKIQVNKTMYPLKELQKFTMPLTDAYKIHINSKSTTSIMERRPSMDNSERSRAAARLKKVLDDES